MIRLAEIRDLEQIDKIAERAILNMQENGIEQWTLEYPRLIHFKKDILVNGLFIVEDKGQIVACAAILPENDVPYKTIDTWEKEKSFVMHRVVVDPLMQQAGIASELMTYAKMMAIRNGYESIKIDTYPENFRMKNFLQKHGFVERGYLKVINRDAYEWVINPNFMKKMKRVLVFGASGTGKTTVCQQIGEKYNLTPLHLDSVYWKKDWNRIDKEDFQVYMKDFLTKHKHWVIDGNYTNNDHFEYRLKLATTIVFLDYGRQVSLKGIHERASKFKHRVRPDMPEGCVEGIDQVFLKYVAGFSKKNDRLKAFIKKYDKEKQILIFKSRKELHQWFNKH